MESQFAHNLLSPFSGGLYVVDWIKRTSMGIGVFFKILIFFVRGEERGRGRGRGNRRSTCRDYAGLGFEFVFVKDDGRVGVDV